MQTSVRVMRSFDYCHFEIALTADVTDLDAANELRKQAAVLVDEAVRQYKIAKKQEDARAHREWDLERALTQRDALRKLPPSELTIEQAALLRSYEDHKFWDDFDRESYIYDNTDPEREHHFSMLSQFKESRVSAATAGTDE